MGLFRKRSEQPAQPEPPQQQAAPQRPNDPRLPGVAGFHGVGLKKNAMPEMRFEYVRPDQQQRR